MAALHDLEAHLTRAEDYLNIKVTANEQAVTSYEHAKQRMRTTRRVADDLQQQYTRDRSGDTKNALKQMQSQHEAARQTFKREHKDMWEARNELTAAVKVHTSILESIEGLLTPAKFLQWDRERRAAAKQREEEAAKKVREEAQQAYAIAVALPPSPTASQEAVSVPIAAVEPAPTNAEPPSEQVPHQSPLAVDAEMCDEDCDCEECEAAFHAPRPTR